MYAESQPVLACIHLPALSSGNFVDDLVDDVGDFSDAKLVSVLKWRDFFRRSEARHSSIDTWVDGSERHACE